MTPPPDPRTDAELVAVAQSAGPQAQRAFDALVTRHEAWLIRYLHHLLRDLAAAEDIAQIAFVQAYLALPRFRGDSAFRTWLRSIATRAAYNHMRSSKRRRSYEEQADGPMAATGDQVALADAINKVMGTLPHSYREILTLRHLEELSVEEIAGTLDISLSAAKMRLKRARERFFALYDDMVEPHAS